MRWQIELAFKRLKGLGGFAGLRASDLRLVETWLLALLTAACHRRRSRPLACEIPAAETAAVKAAF